MRLRQRDLKPYTIKRRISIKEPDGTTSEEWGPAEVTIRGNVQPAGGRLMAEMYGERIAYMLTMYVEPGEVIPEANPDKPEWIGACIYKNVPDYRLIAVRPWNAHKVIDLEAIRP